MSAGMTSFRLRGRTTPADNTAIVETLLTKYGLFTRRSAGVEAGSMGTVRWGVDVAYQFIYREERDIADSALSPVVDGTWTNTMHGVMLSATYRF